MITVSCKGWLGNVLFQYAVGRVLALKHGTDLRLDLGRYMTKRDPRAQWMVERLRSFNLSASLHRPVRQKVLKRFGVDPPTPENFYREVGFGFDPGVLAQDDGVCINGYFQSEHYFKPIEAIIREDLTVHAFGKDREVTFLGEQISGQNSVAVHVRRGDYVAQPFFNVCTLGYFSRAITYMKDHIPSPEFYVFSDDIAWCRHNLRGHDLNYVEAKAAQKNPVADMHLMSLCKHNIISNSTFSWWGAWLNKNRDKTVVAPNRWFGDDDVNLLAMRDTVVRDWVQIEV